MSETQLRVRVIPRAGRSEVAGMRDEAVLIRLAAPPVDGAANDELIDLLARTLRLPKRNFSIASGGASRTKRVRIDGMAEAQVFAALGLDVPQ